MRKSQLLALASFGILVPAIGAEAQPRRAQTQPRVVAPRTPSASQLLERRRELDLTPRQVAQLDSIERVQFAQQRARRERMVQLRDSVCGDRRTCVLSPEQRDQFRAQMEANRGQREEMFRADSLARTRSYAVLDSTQRSRLQSIRERQVRQMRGGTRARMESRGFRRSEMRRFDRGRPGIERRMRSFDRGQRMRMREFGPRWREE